MRNIHMCFKHAVILSLLPKQEKSVGKKIADCVNACNPNYKRSWQQIKTKYKNIIQSEELALSSNKGRPIMDGITGAVQSDPGAGSSQQVTLVEGNTVSLLKPAHFHTVSHTEGEANDEDTLSVCSETIAEDFSQPAPQTDASTSMGFRRNVNKVETDSVRALYKRSLELDCTLKELDCELRSLQIKKIKLEIKQLEKQISVCELTKTGNTLV
ncbi:uncharacterized protein LOC131539601 isoform X2 [Onychostoma macrolepis]|uniref:uncharacterized protein LOC131539601 isoform X2 n=1 Tax=Onychostoma macrolepis TaxID=369639 RepID=UPI00272B950A|nr:uncharacterized protein LOC131539601 isoform X2 [Onychostoma macrolepis]